MAVMPGARGMTLPGSVQCMTAIRAAGSYNNIGIARRNLIVPIVFCPLKRLSPSGRALLPADRSTALH